MRTNTSDEARQSNFKIRHSTQVMSLFVGGLMVFMGAWGIFFDAFIGVHAKIFYWIFLSLGGLALVYFGHHDRRKASMISCAVLGLGFLAMGIMDFLHLQINDGGFTFIMANYSKQGSVDYILSFIIAAFLFGGAYDWFRRNRNQPPEPKRFNPVLK